MKQLLLSILIFWGVGLNGFAKSVKFQFYGTELSVKAKTKGFPSIEYFDTANVKKIMLAIDKDNYFGKTIKNCQILKEKLQLNDWGVFCHVRRFFQFLCKQVY